MRRVHGGGLDCKEPGDFAWVIEYKEEGALLRRPIKEGETPTHMWFVCPRGTRGCLPLNGHSVVSWDWDGDLDKPTLNPSIWHDKPTGWHGWIKKGEMIDA